MANWEAEQACPGLIMVPPHYDLYLKYSRLVRRIYRRYCNDIEPFGMDENWLSIPCTYNLDSNRTMHTGYRSMLKNRCTWVGFASHRMPGTTSRHCGFPLQPGEQQTGVLWDAQVARPIHLYEGDLYRVQWCQETAACDNPDSWNALSD